MSILRKYFDISNILKKKSYAYLSFDRFVDVLKCLVLKLIILMQLKLK